MALTPPDQTLSVDASAFDRRGQLLNEACNKMRGEGLTWFRATLLHEDKTLVVEGWKEIPDEPTPPPTE